MELSDDQIARELCSTKGGSWAAMHCNNVHIPTRLRSALQVHLLHMAASRYHKRPRHEGQASLRPAKRVTAKTGTPGSLGAAQALSVEDIQQALLTAVVTGAVSELQQLVQKGGAGVNHLYAQGRNLLHAAAEAGQAGSCQALLELEADIWLYDESGVSPMMLAAKHGHHSIVKALLESGADPFQVDQSGTNALLLAAACGSAACIKLLLQEGYVDADYHNSDLGAGEHALLLAAESGWADCVELPLAAGAKVNRADQDGRTALWVASRGGHLAVVQLLLSQPCIKHIRHFSSSSSPIQEAQAAGHAAVVSLLAAHLAQQQQLPQLPELPAVGKQGQRQRFDKAKDSIKRLQRQQQRQHIKAGSQSLYQQQPQHIRQQQQHKEQSGNSGQQNSSMRSSKKRAHPSSVRCVAAAVAAAGPQAALRLAPLPAEEQLANWSPVALAY